MFDDEEEEDLYSGDINEDVKIFNEMYEKDSYQYFDSDRIEAIIDHLLVTNQYKKAKWATDHALTHFPYNSLFSLRKAQALSIGGDLKEAIRILVALEKVEQSSVDLMITMASCFSQLRDAESAIKYYKKALILAEKEDRADIYIDLAMEYENLGDYNGAISILKNAIKEDVKNESLVYELAYCYDQIEDYSAAIQCFLDFIDVDPYSYTAWYNLGNAYFRTNQYDKAIWAYDYCILVNEDFAPAYFNMGNTYMEIENIPKALEYYEECLKMEGEDGMVLCSIGECYEELGQYNRSYEAYKKSTDFLPQLADAWLGRGIVSDLLGEQNRAISELKVAVKLEPSNAEYKHTLASVYESKGEFDLAVKTYEEALGVGKAEGNLLFDYLKCLALLNPVLVIDKLNVEPNWLNQDASLQVLIFVYFVLNRRTDALLLFEELLAKDKELIKEVMEAFPILNDYTTFTDRIEE